MFPTLALTATLHYLALIPIFERYWNKSIPFFNNIYKNTILYSTIISILSNYFDKSINLLYFNYGLTVVWIILDILWSLLIKKPIINYLNILIYVMYFSVKYLGNYLLYHNIWQIISAIKCLYISYLIDYYEVK